MGTEAFEVTLAVVIEDTGEVVTKVAGDKQAVIKVGRTFMDTTISEEITTW